MPLVVFFFSLTACFCLAAPEQAFAWGPGAHLVTGNWLLQNLSALPAVIASIIMNSPAQFLHGLLGADIFIGKGCKAKAGHSHNWESGFALLNCAQNPCQQAFAYGYLCHLAADTVAHNVFVPGFIHTAPGRGKTAHIYLEIQADSLIDWHSSDALKLFSGQESVAALAMLRRSMHKKNLPFWLSARMYQGSIFIGGSRLWRGSMEAVDNFLWERDRSEQLTYLLRLSTKAMVNILQDGSASKVLSLDPIGEKMLQQAEKRAGQGRRLLAESIRRRLSQTLGRRLNGITCNLTASQYAPLADQNSLPSSVSLSVDVPPVLQSLPSACGRN